MFGGSGFSENYDYNQLIQSNCTTLEITQDFSNYWVVSATPLDKYVFFDYLSPRTPAIILLC